MKQLLHFGGLRIDTEGATKDVVAIDAKAETPQTPTGTKAIDVLQTTPQNLRRSDTADSLSALVGRSPGLSHVKELESLPSPIVPSRELPVIRNRETQSSGKQYNSHPSPLSKAAPFDDDEDKTTQNSNRNTLGVLPPKLAARLQGERNRISSLHVSQPVSNVELPRSSRHRSQSQVQAPEGMNLQREPNLAINRYGDVQANVTGLNATAEQELFSLPFDGELRHYLAVNQIGEGTFSRVVLARDQGDAFSFVAIKAVELLASGTADKSRVEMTVRREIELLSKFRHPLVINLHGSIITDTWAYLVLDYCPGGDLFMLASQHATLLTPRLIRRIFAELVIAIQFLHTNHIVHRDIKLENVLLRYPPDEIRHDRDQLLTTLTDLGLARQFDPMKPDISTRCGSEDYAAPEIVMGQPYDGRQSDAWALGAVLYCLLEGRLPFDIIPGLEHRMKATKVLHRICRIEWRWVSLKDRGHYDSELEGAKRVVVNLLRSRTKRWTLKQVMHDEWLRDEIAIVTKIIDEKAL